MEYGRRRVVAAGEGSTVDYEESEEVLATLRRNSIAHLRRASPVSCQECLNLGIMQLYSKHRGLPIMHLLDHVVVLHELGSTLQKHVITARTDHAAIQQTQGLPRGLQT